MDKPFGLPTYPIQGGMRIGSRDIDEIEWLLEHGNIQSDLYQYAKIVKVSSTEYRLIKVEDDRHEDKQKILLTTTTLSSLLNGVSKPIDITGWYWYPRFV